MASDVHALCEEFMRELVVLDPVAATYFGVPGHDEDLRDYSPAGHAKLAEFGRDYLARMRALEPGDDAETLAKAVFCERLGVEEALDEAGLRVTALNSMHCAVQEIRDVFDLMPTSTAADWGTIARRLAKVPAALDGVRESLRHGVSIGRVAAKRQVRKVAGQCETWAGRRGVPAFFPGFVAEASTVDGVDDALRAALDQAAVAATEAYREFGDFLRTELLAHAPAKDAVGEQVYTLWSRYFTGGTFDLPEAYAWGWQEFLAIEAEMQRVAERIKPGASIAEAAAALDADERYRLRGREELKAWMQKLSDEALESLRGKHFDIPDEVMALECLIAPTGGSVGAYYTGPSEDFARPGRMWWSLPADREEFSTWREVSTVYHEGAPGHHLQIASTVYAAESLNRFQRMGADTSGNLEGWALYAERLMRELGYLDDDGNLLGMLDAQLFRAARVVVDIGMHLELEIPAGTGFHEGETWTPELGLEFMLTRTIGDEANLRDEIDRYLGWPGQAPSYKLGERVWLQAREAARERHGERFSTREFHGFALGLGGMGLDVLRERLAAF